MVYSKYSLNYNIEYLFCAVILCSILFNSCNNNITDSKPIGNNEGLSIYLSNVKIGPELTFKEVDLDTAKLIGEPVITYNEIIKYDTSGHIITLSISRDSLLKRIGAISVYGNSFVVTLDSQKVYGGWFWTWISSVPCNSVVIILQNDPSNLLSENEIKLKLGYPSEEFFKGADPRSNKKIIERLVKDKKAK